MVTASCFLQSMSAVQYALLWLMPHQPNPASKLDHSLNTLFSSKQLYSGDIAPCWLLAHLISGLPSLAGPWTVAKPALCGL